MKQNDRDNVAYKCQICGFENVTERINGRNPTVIGDYGSNATPTPTTYDDEMYQSDTITFIYTPLISPLKRIVDSNQSFRDKHIMDHWTLVISTDSGINDGTYTVTSGGVSRGEILVEESLTDEATPGTVTISRRIYQPNITTGCPFCGSKNSKE